LPRPVHKLRLLSVSKVFVHPRRPPTEVVRDIDLDVRANEFVCVLGQSGCGKTTLLKLIAGLEELSEGRIVLDGRTIRQAGADRALVFQQPALLPWLSMERNVALGLEIRGMPTSECRSRVAEVLELVGLPSAKSALPRELSGGMAQRVALARALVNEPEVLLLDEPFGALDAMTRRRLQEELLRVWEENRCTAIFVTHDLEEALLLGDRIVVMQPNPGRVAAIHAIELPRPRERSSPSFQAALRKLSTALHETIVSENASLDEMDQTIAATTKENAP